MVSKELRKRFGFLYEEMSVAIGREVSNQEKEMLELNIANLLETGQISLDDINIDCLVENALEHMSLGEQLQRRIDYTKERICQGIMAVDRLESIESDLMFTGKFITINTSEVEYHWKDIYMATLRSDNMEGFIAVLLSLYENKKLQLSDSQIQEVTVGKNYVIEIPYLINLEKRQPYAPSPFIDSGTVH